MSDEEDQIPEELNDILFTLSQTLKPAATLKESTMTLTTAEFADKIRAHYPPALDVPDAVFYQLFKKKGYNYELVAGNRLEWLINKE